MWRGDETFYYSEYNTDEIEGISTSRERGEQDQGMRSGARKKNEILDIFFSIIIVVHIDIIVVTVTVKNKSTARRESYSEINWAKCLM